VIQEAIPQPFQHHQVLWELDQRPGLLTGDGAHASPRASALIQALLAAGAVNVVALACPSCGRTVPLSHRCGALLSPLLRPGPVSGLQPLPATCPGDQPHRGRRAGLRV
jgi:hypothetical protein